MLVSNIIKYAPYSLMSRCICLQLVILADLFQEKNLTNFCMQTLYKTKKKFTVFSH